jgi:hypothetical protein
MGSKWQEFKRTQKVYGEYALSLVMPGSPLPVLPADQSAPAALTEWSKDELILMIDEGRRQLDRQQDDLRDVRGRAQWLFTVAVAGIATLGAGLASRHTGVATTCLWLFGLLVLTWGVAGAASVMVSRADLMTIHTAVLSGAERPIDRSLAGSYSRIMSTGENTVATRLTVFRQAAVFCLAGGYLGLIAVLISR